MKNISGLPPEVRGVFVPLIVVGLPVTAPPPSATESRALAGTEVTVFTTEARAEPVGPFDPWAELADGLPPFSLTMTKTSTTASTTTTLPPARKIRRRCSDRRSAARCAAIFSQRVDSTFVLLALPMLASSNPLCVPDNALYRRRFAALVRAHGRTQSEPSASGENLLSEWPACGPCEAIRWGANARK